jgi:hypothetical protein
MKRNIWGVSVVSPCRQRFKVITYVVIDPNVTPPSSGPVRTPRRSKTNNAAKRGRQIVKRSTPTPSPQESPLRDYGQPPFTQKDPLWKLGRISNLEAISHRLQMVDGVSEQLFWRCFFECRYCGCIVRQDLHDCSSDESPIIGAGANSRLRCGYEADDEAGSLPVNEVIDLTTD